MFTKAKWIWKSGEAIADDYADFLSEFSCTKNQKLTLTIAADSNYAVWLNGNLAAFGQYADYPNYKVYDEVDLSPYAVEGKNRLALTVWYYGLPSQTYVVGNAGVIYEVAQEGRVLVATDENTLSRQNRGYVCGEKKFISGQLGLTYHYNMNDAEPTFTDGFTKSVLVPAISTDFHKRPISMLTLSNRLPARVCLQGVYSGEESWQEAQEKMQYAALAFRSFGAMTGCGDRTFSAPRTFHAAPGEKIFFVVDLEEETAGFLDFSLTVPAACRMLVGYGEHLEDGRCRTQVRNFSCVIDLKAGKNDYLHTFRRFGCRYLQFFIESNEVAVAYAGIRPTLYPLTYKKYRCGNLLRETIYAVCQNTMQHCMHEHYEDCPWREQALYCMDSRNQMLCGYYAFGEKAFPRASLRLMAQGLRPDGILSICYPSGTDAPIPSFSLIYFIQMREYITYTGDTTLAAECYGVLRTILAAFRKKLTDNGLIDNFHGPGGYWNFYEWSPTMSGTFNEQNRYFEAPINAYLSLALQNMALIANALGKDEDAAADRAFAANLNAAIQRNFYDKETGMFESFLEKNHGEYSVLNQALCLLCGAGEGVNTEKILRVLASNGKDNMGMTVYPNTLSMNSFRFDALLACNREKYKSIILNECDRDYLHMLRKDATSFWETIEGASAFDDAGSLCHGWSALPIYYYEILQ